MKFSTLSNEPEIHIRVIRAIRGLSPFFFPRVVFRASGAFGSTAQEFFQDAKIYRLNEVVIKAGGPGAVSIAITAVACDGDEPESVDGWSGSKALGNLKAGHSWQPDVQKHDGGIQASHLFQTFGSIVSNVCLVPHDVQHRCERFRGVGIIVDNEDALSFRNRRRVSGYGL
jgi:hypothetical protein